MTLNCTLQYSDSCRSIYVCNVMGQNIVLVYINGDYNPNCLIQLFDEVTQINSAVQIAQLVQKAGVNIPSDAISTMQQYFQQFLLQASSSSSTPIEVRAEDIMSIRDYLLQLAYAIQNKIGSNDTLNTVINLLQSIDVKAGDVVLGEPRNILSQAMYLLMEILLTLIPTSTQIVISLVPNTTQDNGLVYPSSSCSSSSFQMDGLVIYCFPQDTYGEITDGGST